MPISDCSKLDFSQKQNDVSIKNFIDQLKMNALFNQGIVIKVRFYCPVSKVTSSRIYYLYFNQPLYILLFKLVLTTSVKFISM